MIRTEIGNHTPWEPPFNLSMNLTMKYVLLVFEKEFDDT